jgi:hypothetical protein
MTLPRCKLVVRTASALLLAAASLTPAAEGPPIGAATPPAATTPPLADRVAILAMAGEYRVTFRFDETVGLRTGYQPQPTKTSAGTELVVVVEDSPTRILLQHLLLDPRRNAVVKHWRQDWSWQERSLLEFRGDRRWVRRELGAAETAGRWVQSVYEVDDSPRYASLGRWEHRGQMSEWTSESTWRPLPRREHTTRNDYDVLVGVNRHIITPWGWVHAQDNAKLDLRRNPSEPWLVRETGVNTYRRISDVDFSAAREYWRRTSEYWDAVRRAWARRLGTSPTVLIELEVDGVPVMDSLLGLADDDAQPLAERMGRADAVIAKAARETAALTRR